MIVILPFLLLEADELVHQTTEVLAGGQLDREVDGVGAPLAARDGLGGTPGVDRPEAGRASSVLEGDDGGAGHAEVGLGDMVDLEVCLVPGRGEAAAAAAVKEGLGATGVVRDEQIRGGVVVPVVLVRAVFISATADTEGLGVGPFR